MSTELVIANPGTLMTQATDVAGVSAEIVKRTAMSIQGRKYVRVEGWQSIAAAYGCIASATNVRRTEAGVAATGELRRISDGTILASAEGFVGEDEPTWFGGTNAYGKTLPKRPDYAIQAMAQTRAISRVCRTAFAFVVVLIDSKLSTTPAEEMMGVLEHERAAGGNLPESGTAEHSPTAAGTAAGGPSETRDQTLTRLCKEAGQNKIDLLAKAEVKHADEMSDEDWASALRFLKKKAAAKVPA